MNSVFAQIIQFQSHETICSWRLKRVFRLPRQTCGVGIILLSLMILSSSLTATRLDAGSEQPGLKVLIIRCLECHGTDLSGGLDLRTAASALKGGESGAAFFPGSASESLLMQYVESDSMPPQHPLSDEEKSELKAWINSGASYPDHALDLYEFTTHERAGYDWWSLQPLAERQIPDVESTHPNLAPIDRFIVARLNRSGLSQNPAASRADYIRRVSYDLTGLLPTFAEIQDFVNDPQQQAEERLVERLLASPHYGERWGRHWLDVVRFAESNGFERDRLRTNLWPYRDYVIRAFNADMPYNQFVRSQLAGDALSGDHPDNLIATGFLSAGPKNDVETVSELEQKITRADELDEYVSTAGTTFLGLTIGCARCHDHKFDPIPTADYYAMTAIFSGLDRGDVTTATRDVITKHQTSIASADAALATAQSDIEDYLENCRQGISSPSELEIGNSKIDLPVLNPVRNEDDFAPHRARLIRFSILQTQDGNQPCLDEIELYGLDEKLNLALASGGAIATASSELPGFEIHKVAHLNDGKHGNSQSWISQEAGTGWAQIELTADQLVSKVIWGRDREGRYQDRLATVYHIDGSLDGVHWERLSGSDRRPAILSDRRLDEAAVVQHLSSEQREEYERLALIRNQFRASRDAIPQLPNAYLAIAGKPRTERVLYRGDVNSPREEVHASGLSAIQPLEHEFDPANTLNGPERRLKFAEWIVDPRNPLTARVWVNRVWQYHFGIGLVDTPNDFGFNGEQPSHPELLDWLADDFIKHGWSTKRLTQQIVLSQTYRQSSAWKSAAEIDGRNRLLWRFSPQRLTAESLRDRILQVSGALNTELYGPSFRLFNYVDGNVPDYELMTNPGPETWRRAVYAFNIRTFTSPLMSAFDCPDPSVQTPVRASSTTALQALSLMNSQFVFEQSQKIVDRIQENSKETEEHVQLAYRIILTRDPDEAELQKAAQFVQEHGLFSLCRVLLNTNEFLYVY